MHNAHYAHDNQTRQGICCFHNTISVKMQQLANKPFRVITLDEGHTEDKIWFERWRQTKRENDRKRETHLQVSVVTDRLRVSSSVSASRVRHR